MANITFNARDADPKVLSDEELSAGAKYWRDRQAAEGMHADASSRTTEVMAKFERELSARFGGTTTIAADLEPPPVSRSWWKRH